MTSEEPVVSPSSRESVLVSHVGPDIMWAEWIAEQLGRAGYDVDKIEWTAEPSPDPVARLEDVAGRFAHIVVVISDVYMATVIPRGDRGEAILPWAAIHRDVLIPVLVRETELPDRFGTLSPVNLVSATTAADAARRLFRRLPGSSHAPAETSLDSITRFPGHQPPVFSVVPPPNPYFTGRSGLLRELRSMVTRNSSALLHSINGLGGVGKTQLAAEYAYRFASDYDIVWWVNATNGALARGDLAKLAIELGLGTATADPVELVESARNALRLGKPYARWLLVFDNAGDPARLKNLMPHGRGHVLVTSRDRRWEGQAEGTVDVDVYERAESTDFLQRKARLGLPEAEQLAEALADLPLALEHASGFLSSSAMTMTEYLGALRASGLSLLGTGTPEHYETTVAATWSVSQNLLHERNRLAATLLDLCAFLGPEPIPLSLLAQAPDGILPTRLAKALRDPVQRAALLNDIRNFSLAKITDRGEEPFTGPALLQHLIVKTVVRESLPQDDQDGYRAACHQALAAANPGDADNARNWPVYTALLPHVLASEAAASTSPEVRALVLDEAQSLRRRAEFQACLELVESASTAWSGKLDPLDPDMDKIRSSRSNALEGLNRFEDSRRANKEWYDQALERLGPEHPATLLATSWVARDFRLRGEPRVALDMDQHIFDVELRMHGRDSAPCMRAAHNLAVSLRVNGRFADALEIDQYNARVRAEREGPDSIRSLFSINNVARDLRELGDYQRALDLQRGTARRYKETLGEDAPETLRALKNLAVTLRKAGDYQAAAELAEEVLERHRRVMGSEHPETLAAFTNLANDHRCLGQYATGQGLAEQAVRSYRRLFGSRNATTASMAVNLAALLRLAGDPERARQVNEEALPVLRAAYGDGHRYTLSCAVNLASDFAEMDDPVRARALGEPTLAALRQGCGQDHPYTLSCAVNLALDLRALSERDASRELTDDTMSRYSRTLGNEHPEAVAAAARERAVCDIEPPPL